MDFSHSSLRQDIGSNPDREFKGFEGDDGDDEYFAELQRQILQLMADDDEEDDHRFLGTKSSGAGYPYKENFGTFSPPALQPGVQFDGVQNKGGVTFPTIGSDRKIGAGLGTGVFIPLAIPRRSRVRSGRTNNQKRHMYRRVENKQE